MFYLHRVVANCGIIQQAGLRPPVRIGQEVGERFHSSNAYDRKRTPLPLPCGTRGRTRRTVPRLISMSTPVRRRHMNVVNGRISRNDPKRVVMFRHAELAHSGAVSPDADIKAARPARGRRLALWVASASALAVVVTCIVAYGDRFDYEQAPGIVGPTSPAQSTSWSGHVALPSSPPARGTAVTSVELAPPVSSAPSDHRAGSTPDSAAPQSVTRGHAETRDAATQNRRHSAPHVRAISRHAPEITRSTSPTRQASSSGHVATSSSPPARKTAIGSVELAPPV